MLALSHVQMRYRVKIADCGPAGRKVSQPVIRDLFTFLVSQCVLIFDRKPFVRTRKMLSEAFGMCCTRGPVLGENKCLNVWVCHSKSRTSVTIAFID